MTLSGTKASWSGAKMTLSGTKASWFGSNKTPNRAVGGKAQSRQPLVGVWGQPPAVSAVVVCTMSREA
jgi:hypothetical protein